MTSRIRFVLTAAALVLLALPQRAFCQSVQVTITSDPPLQNFTMEGQGCTPGTYKSPQTLLWTKGAKCTATWLLSSATSGARYIFEHWEDKSESNRRTITVPSENAIYTATVPQVSLVSIYVKCANVQRQPVPCGTSPGNVTISTPSPGFGFTGQPLAAEGAPFLICELPMMSAANVIARANQNFAFLEWAKGEPLTGISVKPSEAISIGVPNLSLTAVFTKLR